MKILHCADIHLDSAMTANLDKDKARERRSELLASFKDANFSLYYLILLGNIRTAPASERFESSRLRS